MSYLSAAAYIGMALAAAGTAASAYGNSKATRQANSVLLSALAGNKKNMDEVDKELQKALPQFEKESRVKAQEDLAKETAENVGDYVSDSQIVRASQQGSKGDVSSEYETAKAKADAKALEEIRNLAQMMGNVTAAQRLRQKEGFGLADLTNRINLLNSFNNGNQRVAQLQAQAKANGQQGWKLGGEIAGALGTAISMGAGLASAAPTAAGGSPVNYSLANEAMGPMLGGAKVTPAAQAAFANGVVSPQYFNPGVFPKLGGTGVFTGNILSKALPSVTGGISKYLSGARKL